MPLPLGQVPVVGVAGHVAEPRFVEPLAKVTVPAGAGTPVTTGMLYVRGSAVPTVVVLFAAVTASAALETWFTTTVVFAVPDE